MENIKVRLLDAIEKLGCTDLEHITLLKNNQVIFSGTILGLKSNQNLLQHYLIRPLKFVDRKGVEGYLE